MMKKVAIVYALVLLALASLYYLGLYTPEPPYEDEFYLPLGLAGGPIVWFLSIYLSGKIMSVLHWELPAHVAIIVIPGIINWMLGSLQWYWIARLIRSITRSRS